MSAMFTVISIFFLLYSSNCQVLPTKSYYSLFEVAGDILSRVKKDTNPEWGFDDHRFAYRHGYCLEIHDVTTEDGYVLNIARLSSRLNNTCAKSNSSRPVALLIHPMTSLSTVWIASGADSLGFMLVDAGYDVWMNNARGTAHSRKHVKLDPNSDAKFWDFSFDEIGYYDLPATIDYILNHTGQEKLLTTGFSMSTAEVLALCSRRPEYNKKIQLSVFLGSAVFLKHMDLISRGTLRALDVMGRITGVTEIFRQGQFIPELARILCSDGPICKLLFDFIFRPSPYSRKEIILVILTWIPNGISLKTIQHLLQLTHTDNFNRFDYGLDENIKIYNSTSAPEYNLTAVTSPVAIFYSPNDCVQSPKMVEKLVDKLPNVVHIHKMPYKFTHPDYVLSRDLRTILNKHIVNIFDMYSKK